MKLLSRHLLFLAWGIFPYTAGAADERDLQTTVDVPAARHDVWLAWTTDAGARTFFAPKTNIHLEIGGPYEIFFNPADDRMSTKGRTILSYVPDGMISFQWNLPRDSFPQLSPTATWVVVELTPISSTQTRVTIHQLGWGEGEDWDRAYSHMQQGWNELAQRLKARFTTGAVDWEKQAMMWKSRVKQ